MSQDSIYAAPLEVSDIRECVFYHTMEIPGHGIVQGEWDLRDGVDAYLGGVNFQGKRVLELGPANGFLSFQMERRGADVVSYDLSENDSWDVVPYCAYDHETFARERQGVIRKLNNGYWFAHKAHRSQARVVYGSVYDLPGEIGPVDISTCCSILLHLRDPFLALQRVLPMTQETLIVCDRPPRKKIRSSKPYMQFLPDFRKCEPKEGWWRIPPETVAEFAGVFGFEDVKITYHKQPCRDKKTRLYTLVAHRTRPAR